MRMPALIAMLTATMACARTPVPNPPSPLETEVRYRVVRFLVKPGSEEAFLRFFTESVVPAAEAPAESRELLLEDLAAFILLRPMHAEPDGRATFYIL